MSLTKLETLILYVSQVMEEREHVGRGRIKLAKLLFRIDFAAYARWGQPVTETAYHADKLGPVPIDELMATKDLEAYGLFEWRTVTDRERLPTALEPADLDARFSASERALIDEILDQYERVSGEKMVDEAHEFPGWVQAWRGGQGARAPIPFESVFWSPRRQVEAWENEYAMTLVRDRGL